MFSFAQLCRLNLINVNFNNAKSLIVTTKKDFEILDDPNDTS